MNEVAKVEKTNAIIEMGPTGGLLPKNFEGLWRMASIFQASGFMPKGMEKIESIFVALQLGMEVGLHPMQAVQSIASINGRPCVWGDAVIGLVQGSNLLEEMLEYFENEAANYPDNMTAICQVKRKGGREVIQKFSVADAKKASLWNKSGPWSQYPRRMLQMRARGFALRDLFPDILKGLKMAEEVMDYDVDLKPGRNGVYQAAAMPPEQEDNTELYKPKVVEKLEKDPPLPPPVGATKESPAPKESSPARDNETSASEEPKQEGSQNGNTEPPPPVKEEDPQTRFDNYFRAKWINLRKPGFSDFVWKNPADFKKASESVRQEARTKWAEFYPTVKFPACIALQQNQNGGPDDDSYTPYLTAQEKESDTPVADEVEITVEETVMQMVNSPEYREFFKACEIDPGLAAEAKKKVFGVQREPQTLDETKELLKIFNQLLDEKMGPGF